MADFSVTAFSVSIGAYNTAINLASLGAELVLGAPIEIVIDDADGALSVGPNPDALVQVGDDAQGGITDVFLRTFASTGDGAPSYDFAVLARDLTADYLLLPLDPATGAVLTANLPAPGAYVSQGPASASSILLGDSDLGEVIPGTDGNDTLLGTALNDTMSGGEGDDSLDGLAGNDLMAGASGNDTIAGGDGDDSIGGGTGDDAITGGAGNDVIGAGQGNDTATGGPGNDVVNGGAGNDSLSGGQGNDTMGAGFNNDTVNGGGGNDSLGGGTGRDVLNGGGGDDSIGGGEGDDTVQGGAGDDFLAGGGRNDVIDGGDGNDKINGGDGDDTMTGGAGADEFIYNFFKDGDADVITDFEDGVDSLRMTGVANAPGSGLAGKVAALNIVDTQDGALLTYEGHTILLEGIVASDLGLEDFTFL